MTRRLRGGFVAMVVAVWLTPGLSPILTGELQASQSCSVDVYYQNEYDVESGCAER